MKSLGYPFTGNPILVIILSGYDFGYLLKVLTSNPLPPDEETFLRLLGLFFPRFYDIKFLMKGCKNLKGGLQDIADDLGVSRIGTQHQAGSDSHLTCLAYFPVTSDSILMATLMKTNT